jgi:TRAP transporter 4TM/12TM fusion protein
MPDDQNKNKEKMPSITGTRYRELGKVWKPIFALITFLGILFSIHEIFRLGWISYQENFYYYGILAIFLSSVFLLFPVSKGFPKNKVPWYDFLLFLLTIACCGYLMFNAFRISAEGWSMVGPTSSIVVSFIMWGLCLEALRRGGGLILFIFVGIICIYPLFAEHMPGFLEGTGWSLAGSAKFHVLTRESLFGIPTRTFCELMIGFMVFSSTLQITGGGVFFARFASALLGRARGGPAKVSVVASCFFGMISGSAVANVATVGPVTIPTMKRTGYEAEYASAVEACASSGGCIMPPVMGAVAFVMASWLAMPYASIALAAAVPALLYYWGLFVQIDGHAARKGLRGLSTVELPSLKETVKEGWIYLGAIVALIYLLFQLKQEAQAPYVASVMLLIEAMFRKETRPNVKTLYNIILNSGTVLVEMIAILAGIGLIMGGLSMTGIAISFSSEIVHLLGKNPFAMLIMGAFVSYILGMGMPMTPCYIILAIVLVPALIPLGFDVMSLHLFVLYCGLFSYITPPVALSAYVAAIIGGADFWKTGFQAMRLGYVKYLVPFFFVYDPSLILHGDNPVVISIRVIKSFLGVWILASSIEGYLIGVGKLVIGNRIIYLIAGFLLFIPGWWTDAVGLGLFGVMFILDLLRRRHEKPIEAMGI